MSTAHISLYAFMANPNRPGRLSPHPERSIDEPVEGRRAIK
jgi:hypothetical protein